MAFVRTEILALGFFKWRAERDKCLPQLFLLGRCRSPGVVLGWDNLGVPQGGVLSLMMFRRRVANVGIGEIFTLKSIAFSGYLGIFLSVSVICVVWSWCVQLAVCCATCEQLHGSCCFGANFACTRVLQWSFGCTCAKCLFAWRGAQCVLILCRGKKTKRFLQCSISSCVGCGNWWCFNFARMCCWPMSSLQYVIVECTWSMRYLCPKKA